MGARYDVGLRERIADFFRELRWLLDDYWPRWWLVLLGLTLAGFAFGIWVGVNW